MTSDLSPVDRRLEQIKGQLGITRKVFDEAYKQMPCNCPGGGVRTEQCRAAGVAHIAGSELLADVGWLLEHVEQLRGELETEATSGFDAGVRSANAERDALRAQRQAALDLCPPSATGKYCERCAVPWPCPTAAALGADDDR